MIDIFVSYAREDRARVEPLVAWLETCGYAVWWDKRISPGLPFDDAIESHLDACRAVLVIWSRNSIDSNWVQAEANEGLERGILVPVMIDAVRPPLPFRRIQGAEIVGYPRQQNRDVLTQLNEALATLLEREVTVAPRGRPARRPWLISAAGIAGIATLAWFLGLAPSTAAPAHFSFAAFAAENREDASIYESLGEEIAFDLQRTTGISVTPPDRRAVPGGLFVSGKYVPSGLRITVQDLATKSELLKQTYPVDRGLNEVQSEVTRDLAALLGKTTPVSTTTPADVYREFLMASSLLREAPTMTKLREARRQFTQITRANPRFTRAFSRLCTVELRMYREVADADHFNAAERNCHRALTLDESDWEVMLSLADLYRTSGQHDKALSIVERAGTLQPNSGAVARALGLIYAATDRDAQAVEAYEIATRIEPNYWRNFNALGTHYFSLGQYREAAHYFTLEIEHVRNKAMSLNNLAGALYLQGDQRAAVTAWQDSISEEPTINALMNLGSVAFFDQDFHASADYYRLAQDLAPQDQRIAGHLADALRALGDKDADRAYQTAISLARNALQIDPEDREVHGDVAAYMAAIGNADAALKHLQQAVSPTPDVDEVYDRVLVYTRLGHREEAEAAKAGLVDLGYPQRLIAADANLN